MNKNPDTIVAEGAAVLAAILYHPVPNSYKKEVEEEKAFDGTIIGSHC